LGLFVVFSFELSSNSPQNLQQHQKQCHSYSSSSSISSGGSSYKKKEDDDKKVYKMNSVQK
jgi:hypothetical protein